MNNGKNIGLYVHIPFCLSKCPYCDFYSVKYGNEAAKPYKSAVIRNISYYKSKFDTVYFGGGTPILLWKEICEILEKADIESSAEITVEANPCLANEEIFKALLKAGVNRISFGVQSLNDNELKSLGRRHSSFTAINAIELAHACGFGNISADIMLGTEAQTAASVTDTLKGLASLPLTHISAYMLKIEENTPYSKTRLKLPDEDEVCEIYLNTVAFLEAKGLNQYEISNFAREGYACAHNIKYWNCEEYLGIGPASHSFYKGERFFVKRDINAFCESEIQKTELEEKHPASAEEYAMLRLRLSEGLNLKEYEKRGGNAKKMTENIKKLPRKLVFLKDGNVLLTSEGFLLSNTVIGRLLGY